jgi:hypothetical protein
LQRKIKMCILGKLNTHFLRFSFHWVVWKPCFDRYAYELQG